MKKILSIIILSLILCGLLTGCVPTDEATPDGGVTDKIPDNSENDTSKDNGSEENNSENNNSENNGSEENNSENNDSENNNPAEDDKGKENDDQASNPPPVGTEVGDLFGSITLTRLDGGSVSPDDYRGKIVIVNIWATWCPPCKAELPDFDKIADEYADDVVIIAAHTPSGSANAKDYVETNLPDTKIIFAYDTAGNDAYVAAGGDGYVPYTAILDRNGVIIYTDSGVLSYESLASIIENN